MPASANPLQWPDGWRRTPAHQRSRAAFKVTPGAIVDMLFGELTRFRASNVVVSSNLALTRDGRPYAGPAGELADPGVAVYYSTPKFKEQTLACDKWVSVHHNMYAIARTIESWRRIERDGASQILERSFTAFGALPPAAGAKPKRPWWEVLGLPSDGVKFFTPAMVEAQYRELAAKAHPDRGGSADAMAELNVARDEAKLHFAGGK